MVILAYQDILVRVPQALVDTLASQVIPASLVIQALQASVVTPVFLGTLATLA